MSEIVENSVVMTWSVEYTLERQIYFVVYGVDSRALNETSYSIRGNSDTSFTDQTYNITLDGLTAGTEYYAVVVAEYGLTYLTSDTFSFTTRDFGKPSSIQRYCELFALLLFINSSNGATPEL